MTIDSFMMAKLLAAALCVSAMAGCSREEAQPEAAAPAEEQSTSILADPEFRAQIDSAIKEHGQLMNRRIAIVAEMEAMIAAKKAELGEDVDEAALKAALEQDPKWNDLYAQCVEANNAIEAQQARTREMVRQRISK